MKRKMKEILAELYMDPGLMSRFQKDPKAVLQEKGINVPEDREFKVFADTEKVRHIVIPYLGAGKIASVEDFEQRLSKFTIPYSTLI
jgi:hypothetical protein